MSYAGEAPGVGAASPPIPGDHPIHRFYWEAVARRELQLLKCRGCGRFVHYPRPVCPRCLSEDLHPETISGRATLYSYSIVVQPGHPFFVDKVPYAIGVVEIEEEAGVRIPAGIDADESELRCGIPMEVVFKQVTDTLVLPYFVPSRRQGE